MLTRWIPLMNGSLTRSTSETPEFDPLLREADNLLRSAFSTDAAIPGQWNRQSPLVPASEVQESGNELCILVDLPGHDPKAIQVRVEGDTLTLESERKQEKDAGNNRAVRSERSYGRFARSFVLPDSVDASRCDAQYQNGVLTLTFPKREEAKPRAIEVKVRT